MTGENISAVLHFFDNGIFVECDDLSIGKFISKGDGNALMEIINDINDFTNSNTTFLLTEKGEEEAKRLNEEV